MTDYYFWKAPVNGAPEFTSGGHGVTVLPGMGNWVLLNPVRTEPLPEGAVPVADVVRFLEGAR